MEESRVNDYVVRTTPLPRRGERQRERSSKYCHNEFYTPAVRRKKQVARKETDRDQGMINNFVAGTPEVEIVLSAVEEDGPYSIGNQEEELQQASHQLHPMIMHIMMWGTVQNGLVEQRIP